MHMQMLSSMSIYQCQSRSFNCSWPLSMFHIIERFFVPNTVSGFTLLSLFALWTASHECFLTMWSSMMSRKFEGILFPSGEIFRRVYSARGECLCERNLYCYTMKEVHQVFLPLCQLYNWTGTKYRLCLIYDLWKDQNAWRKYMPIVIIPLL